MQEDPRNMQTQVSRNKCRKDHIENKIANTPLSSPAQHIKARCCPPLTLKPSLRDLRIQQLESTESKKMSRFTCPSEKHRCRCPDARRSLSSCTSPLGPTAREEMSLRQERSRRNKKKIPRGLPPPPRSQTTQETKASRSVTDHRGSSLAGGGPEADLFKASAITARAGT
jgi:hypothetical protein